MGAFTPAKQLIIPITGAASTTISFDNVAFPYVGNHHARQIRLYAKGADMVVKFGTAADVVDTTITANTYADLNFIIPAGAVEVFDIEKLQTNITAKSADGTSTGTLYATVGYGEGKNFK